MLFSCKKWWYNKKQPLIDHVVSCISEKLNVMDIERFRLNESKFDRSICWAPFISSVGLLTTVVLCGTFFFCILFIAQQRNRY